MKYNYINLYKPNFKEKVESKEMETVGKKILVLETGAQGSTVAQRMDEEANVSGIILRGL